MEQITREQCIRGWNAATLEKDQVDVALPEGASRVTVRIVGLQVLIRWWMDSV